MKLNFDLVVIGGGSGGIACARRASEYGAKVALIEGDRLGGTCVIRGCIPKKLMMYASTGIDSIHNINTFCWEGINVRDLHFNTSLWQKKKTEEIKRLEDIYEKLLLSSNVRLFRGFGFIDDSSKVKTENEILSTERIVIATGGKPVKDSISGLNLASTSNDILELDHLPEELAVLGSGYIAVEFASILSNFGINVSLFFRSDLPLKGFDKDIRKRLFGHMESLGISMYPNSNIQKIEKSCKKLTVTVDGHRKQFDKILNALGRSPNVPEIEKSLNIARGKIGEILVNDFNETSIPNIFAIGDVTNRLNLTPVAIAEGRALAENEFNNGKLKVEHQSVASAVFSNPPIGSLGLTEVEAQKNSKIRI